MTMALTAAQALVAQQQPRTTKIAVVRFKSSQETPERRTIVEDLSTNLQAAMRANGAFEIPDDATIHHAIEEEGMKPEGLLKQDECLNVGKALNVDYIVVGSAILQGLKWHACARILSVQSKQLVATAEAEYSVDEMKTLYSVLASQIREELANPTKDDSTLKNFAWKHHYFLAYGKRRIDIEPPALLAINAEPPFELSVIADMAVARGGLAVSNFEVFVDDAGLGSIHGDLTPPRPIKERERTIGGRAYLFKLDLKEMHLFTDRTSGEEARYVTSALITVTVQRREEGK
jgi:TolB-like protein